MTTQKTFVVIPRNCTGCRTCELACSMAKSVNGVMGRARIHIHRTADGDGRGAFMQMTCLQCVEEVLQWLHQANWPTQRGLQNVLTVDTPAYEAGPLDGGLVVYFCNFKVLTIQPVHE